MTIEDNTAVDVLWDAVETLWGLMPGNERVLIRRNLPKLIALCDHAEHRHPPEKRAVRQIDWS